MTRSIAGGNERVVALNSKNGKESWRAAVDGRAYGLSVADEMLYVSTDKGVIHCFGQPRPGKSSVIRSAAAAASDEIGARCHTLSACRGTDPEGNGDSTGLLSCSRLRRMGGLPANLPSGPDLQVVCIEEDPE